MFATKKHDNDGIILEMELFFCKFGNDKFEKLDAKIVQPQKIAILQALVHKKRNYITSKI